MGVRESLNSRQWIGISVAGLAVAFGAFLMLRNVVGVGQTPPNVTRQTWFTVDDGKSWFAANADRIAPFEHDGKTAYAVRLWTVDDGKTKFVSHLERLNADAKKKLETMNKSDLMGLAEQAQKIEVKAPLTGDSGWVPISSAQGQRLTSPPQGAGGKTPTAVLP